MVDEASLEAALTKMDAEASERRALMAEVQQALRKLEAQLGNANHLLATTSRFTKAPSAATFRKLVRRR